jgi:hypothetical protein
MKNLCPGKAKSIVIRDDRFGYAGMYRMINPFPEYRIKRKRMKCELCGRKVLSSVQVYHDGHYIYHLMPPHKPKHWWKLKKKRRKTK